MHQAVAAAGSPGFTDPPRESQAVFRAVMNALARPTTIQALAVALVPPAPLTPELAAIALALADPDAPLWLDAPLAASPAVSAYLRFHTGAPIVSDPADASFALVAAPAQLPPLIETFGLGSEEFPDRSTTVVLAVRGFAAAAGGLTFDGPGFAAPAGFSPTPPLRDMAAQWRANRALFPRGVDLVFAGPGQVAALPRSSRLIEER